MPPLKFAVIDSFHDDIRGYDIRFRTVSNEKTGIAKFVYHTRCSVSCVEDSFYGIILKNRLVTAGTFQLFGDILASFFFGQSTDFVIHDDSLTKRFVYTK